MATTSVPPQTAPNEPVDLSDLGFGSKLTARTGQRLLNRDGSFNVKREGFRAVRSSSLYHSALTISWTKFNLIVVCSALLLNTVFACAYLLCGPGALAGATGVSPVARFLDSFFFSVQTSTTIGYGQMAPAGILPNVVVSVEVMTALLGFALATSIMFARFSRPIAKVIFSDRAIVAPYRGITGLEFRMINARRNQLIQLEIEVLLSRMERHGGKMVRRFHALKLERSNVVFFPLNWTVVHPINAESPLHGITEQGFRSWDPEILILLTGIDETFSQTVHARSSYRGDEILWGAKFADMYRHAADGVISVDARLLHATEPASLP